MNPKRSRPRHVIIKVSKVKYSFLNFYLFILRERERERERGRERWRERIPAGSALSAQNSVQGLDS